MAIDDNLLTLLRHDGKALREPVSFQQGDVLFRTDEKSNAMFLIEQGIVRLERVSAMGDIINVHRAVPGSLLAEASLYTDRYHCDAVAESAGQAIRLNREAMLSRLSTDAKFAALFNAYMARELMQLRQRVELLCIRSAAARVRAHLAAVASADGHVASGFVIRQLAEEIGFTPETYSRTLRQLSDAGDIQRNDDGSIDVLARSTQD